MKYLGMEQWTNYMKNRRKCHTIKKAFMRGRVVNKKARWNNCYADFDQQPDYENRRGPW